MIFGFGHLALGKVQSAVGCEHLIYTLLNL
jgi:hypothetical protein